MNSDAMVKRFLRCFAWELEAVGKQLVCPSSSEEDVTDWVSTQAFDLECVQDEERSPADVSFKIPTSLGVLIKATLDLALSIMSVSEMLRVVSGLVDQFTKTLDVTQREVFIEVPIVREFTAVTAPVLSGETEIEVESAAADFIASYPTMVDFLEHFKPLLLEDCTSRYLSMVETGPIVKMPVILAVATRLQPRFYSISSTSKDNPKELTITVGLWNTTTSKGVSIEGACAHYLSPLVGGRDFARIAVQKSSFRMPANPEAPNMMVGAGTGLAPMMGFLADLGTQIRNDGVKSGEIHLFFGCRTEGDFICRDSIEKYQDGGLLKLHLAVSRPSSGSKKYVQHAIAEMGQEACDLLLHKDLHYYVCGDVLMAVECYEACIENLRQHAVMSRVSAVRHLKMMRVSNQWQTDVWGIASHYEASKKLIEKSKREAAKVRMSHFTSED